MIFAVLGESSALSAMEGWCEGGALQLLFGLVSGELHTGVRPGRRRSESNPSMAQQKP